MPTLSSVNLLDCSRTAENSGAHPFINAMAFQGIYPGGVVGGADSRLSFVVPPLELLLGDLAIIENRSLGGT
jgi:hypothetical protein